MTQLQGEQLMASKLIGTTVISSNNESIGDVNDVIMDRQGKAIAVVIGVGGFLGIGEKDVAVAFDKLDFNPPQQTAAANTNPPAGGAAAPGSAGSNNAASTTGSTAGSGTGTAGAANRPAASGNSNREGGVPDRVMLRMTKAELQAAPTFRASGNSGNNNAGSNNAAGGTTAPK
jgi:sporulation protein YlmC with PRC-barrel domain